MMIYPKFSCWNESFWHVLVGLIIQRVLLAAPLHSVFTYFFLGGGAYLVLTVSQPVSLWNNVFTENLLFSSLFCLGVSESNKVFLQDIFLLFFRKQSQKCY